MDVDELSNFLLADLGHAGQQEEVGVNHEMDVEVEAVLVAIEAV